MAETKTKTLHELLAEVQAKLNAPKSRKNTFGNYNYRSCEDILEAVKPLLKEQGLLLTLSDTLVNIGDRYYVAATAKVAIDGSSFEVNAYAREEETKKGMDGSQITGTASSYARKYALNGLFLIDDTKDADTDDHHNQMASGASQPAKSASSQPAKQVSRDDGYYNEYEKKTYYPEPCSNCGKETPAKTVSFSNYKHKRTLCFDCQQLADSGELGTQSQTALEAYGGDNEPPF
jgi:hypothetical protein